MVHKLHLPLGNGPYCFRIHVQPCHRTSTLHTCPGFPPSYGQLYIYDGNESLNQRMGNGDNNPCIREDMEAV